MRLGRKNKKYYKDLHQQAYDRLTGMQAFGESKKEAVKTVRTGRRYFLSILINRTGNTQNIFFLILKKSTRNVRR